MIEILSSEEEISQARAELGRMGADTSRGFRRMLHNALFRIRFRRPADPVSMNKSWDVLQMLKTAKSRVTDSGAAVYEMGSYNSEIPVALSYSGFTNITAADLNPLGRSIAWYGTGIRFRKENFYEPSLEPGSVDLITSLSVIEHGYDRDRLVSTLSSLLRPGGVACLSTDYHEDKIDIPGDFRLFDQTYMIFSKEEIEDLVSACEAEGLKLAGKANWRTSDYPIEFMERKMTFIFLAFVKQ